MSEPTIQRSRAEVERMPSHEIVRALEAGELDALLAGADPGTPALPPEDKPVGSADQGARRQTPGYTREGLRSMSTAEIVAAYRRGDLDHIVRR